MDLVLLQSIGKVLSPVLLPLLGIIAGLVFKRMFTKLESIHVLVNSRMGEAQAEIVLLKSEVAQLQQTVSLLAGGKPADQNIIAGAIAKTALAVDPTSPQAV